MSLIRNKEGNFYPIEIQGTDWHCDWLWSTHRGCAFDCVYCSSKDWYRRFHSTWCSTTIFRLNGETNNSGLHLKRWILPNGKVFISPYNDIMTLPKDDISEILGVVYNSSEYWFDRDVIGHKEKNNFGIILQTKDPAQCFDYLNLIPEGSWIGTTIEYDDNYNYAEISDYIYSKAPSPFKRLTEMTELTWRYKKEYKYFVTIEPIMKFNLFRLPNWMTYIKPDLIFIGANTSKIQLPEPTSEELINLIYSLYEIVGINNVYLKSNIRRLIPAFYDGWKLAKETK